MQPDGFVTRTESLNVLSLYVKDSPARFSRIVETTSFDQFLHVVHEMTECEHVGDELCWMDGTGGIVAIWRSEGFNDCRTKTRAELRAFLEAVRITKDSIEYM
jgi:hypothetical protein